MEFGLRHSDRRHTGHSRRRQFKNGRADFYDYEPINGRSVLVRFSLWTTGIDTAESERAFSEDGGKTWEVNWMTHYARAKKP